MPEVHVQEVYFAIYARVEDGKVRWFAPDHEAVIGSLDGHVWDENAQDWGSDEPEMDTNPYALLAVALDNINTQLQEK